MVKYVEYYDPYKNNPILLHNWRRIEKFKMNPMGINGGAIVAMKGKNCVVIKIIIISGDCQRQQIRRAGTDADDRLSKDIPNHRHDYAWAVWPGHRRADVVATAALQSKHVQVDGRAGNLCILFGLIFGRLKRFAIWFPAPCMRSDLVLTMPNRRSLGSTRMASPSSALQTWSAAPRFPMTLSWMELQTTCCMECVKRCGKRVW